MKRIYGVACGECGKRLFSFFRHDFKTCGCPADTFIDGGTDYIRAGWLPEYRRPKSIYWSKQDGSYPKIKSKVERYF